MTAERSALVDEYAALVVEIERGEARLLAALAGFAVARGVKPATVAAELATMRRRRDALRAILGPVTADTKRLHK